MLNSESGSLLVMIGGFGNSYQRVLSVSEVILVLGSASVALVPGLAPVALGPDSTLFPDFVLFAIYRRSGKFLEHLATWVSGHLEALGV